MKKTNYLTFEPVEHIDPARLAFYVAWARHYQEKSDTPEKPDKKWRFWVSAISLSLGLIIITFLVTV
jgi:hypothetical protein